MLVRGFLLAKFKVVGYKIYLVPNSLPLLRCFLENGEEFNMSSIPVDAAIAIERLANGEDLTTDPRLNLPLMLAEIPGVEKSIRDSISEVFIDDFIQSDAGYVYVATVVLNLNGRSVKKLMVPSNAIILALLSDADVYVDNKFLSETSA